MPERILRILVPVHRKFRFVVVDDDGVVPFVFRHILSFVQTLARVPNDEIRFVVGRAGNTPVGEIVVGVAVDVHRPLDVFGRRLLRVQFRTVAVPGKFPAERQRDRHVLRMLHRRVVQKHVPGYNRRHPQNDLRPERESQPTVGRIEAGA